MNKYNRYKDSGVEWLGEIPEHWEVLPNKRFHKVEKKLNARRECDNILSLTLRGVVNNNPDSPEGMVPKDYATYQVFNKNNLVFKLIDLENIRTSRVGIVHEKGIMSSAYIRLVIGQGNFPRYAYFYFFSLYINEVYNNLGSGVRSTLGPNDLLNIPFLKPPLTEQTAIAQFLDDKTTKIADAIAIKEQQITLLKERKQILIHKAVTRGLDDSVSLKDSGVAWIGEIPEGWEVKRLKYATRIFRGKFTHRPRNDERMYDGEYPFFQTGDVARAGKYLSIFRQTLNEKGLRVSTLFPKGTIIITIAANIGDISILDIDACFPDSIVGFEPNDFVEKHFLYNSLLVMKEQFMSSTIKNTQMNLNVDRIGSNSIVIPSMEEQKEISEYIETASQKIETAINLKKQEIEKLKEYKSSLINGAVTGKVKVC